MRSPARVAAVPVLVGALVAAVLGMVAGPAAGHVLDRTTITCSTVSGTFHDFGIHEHPIVWHVQVGAAAPQTVATTETPAAFVGSGTATADITGLTGGLTGGLNGATATVQAFATWPGGQSATQSADLTCGVPTQVGGIRVDAPAAAPSVAPAAVPVPAAARFTG